MKKLLLIAVITTIVLTATAQSPTTVTTVTNCTVFNNFNTSDEGFSSPSIYSDGNDLSFFWNAAAGAEIENSGFNGSRSTSLISPVFVQPNNGSNTIGFRYVVPSGTQYRIRILSAATSSPLEVIATTANGPIYTTLAGNSGNVCVRLTDADLTLGRQIRFEFTFKTNPPGDILFDDLSITVLGGPLAITFEGITSRKNSDGSAKILWNVGQEVNVKGYYLESSPNGIDFTNAGYVAASGKHVYSSDYRGKMYPITYFRIKNIDIDGSSKYSSIIRVYTNQTDLHLNVYPSPAKDQITVEHNLALQNSMFTVFSVDGIIIRKVTVEPGTINSQLNINTLSKGIYIIRFDNGAAISESVKFVKY